MVTADVRSEARATQHWRSWEGTASSIAWLSREVAQFTAPLREKALREAEQRWEQYGDSEDVIEQRKRSQDEAETKWSVGLTATTPVFETKHSGAPDAVLPEIDGIRLASLTLAVPQDPYTTPRIVIRFDRSRGCDLLVEGEPAWVRSVFGTLVDSIGRGSRWWGWLRTYPAAWALAYLLLLPLFIIYLGKADDPDPAAGFVYAVGAGMLALPIDAATTRLFPGFEIIPEGGRGRGGRVMAGIGTFALSVVASIVAALIL